MTYIVLKLLNKILIRIVITIINLIFNSIILFIKDNCIINITIQI